MALQQFGGGGGAMPLNFVENAFSSVGLDTPVSRGVAVFAGTSAVIMAVKPGGMFDENGAPLPWSFTSGTGTVMPWWAPGVALGVASAILI